MTTIETTAMEPSSPCLPDDLLQWLDPNILVRLSLAAASEVWCDPDWFPFDQRTRETTLDPEILLVVLVYAYATATYSSHLIEQRCAHDRTLRYLTRGRAPDWNTLRRFRRLQRSALRHALAILLLRAWQVQDPTGCRGSSAATKILSLCAGASPQLELMPLFIAAAEERIIRAAQLDSMEADL